MALQTREYTIFVAKLMLEDFSFASIKFIGKFFSNLFCRMCGNALT